jgi:deoxyribodipyrimidine photo-lyase
VNWQEGERWFMQNLVDGDPAANNGGWKWTAGVGTDAAPYFRVFNPVLQGIKFDPQGEYIRCWLPELANLPPEWLHRPAEMPANLQQRYGFNPGRDYPAPIVDHAAARQRALHAYAAARTQAPYP